MHIKRFDYIDYFDRVKLIRLWFIGIAITDGEFNYSFNPDRELFHIRNRVYVYRWI